MGMTISHSFAKDEVKKYTSEGQNFTVENILSRDDVIWGFDFLPDESIIFTERSGKMFHFNPKDKKVTELTGMPKVYASGQGGLLDVRVAPDFAKSHLIFFTYAEPVGTEDSTTAVGSAEFQNHKLTNVKKIFSANFPTEEDYHYGSRIEFDEKGNLLVTVGERGQRLKALELNTHVGKMVRLKPDGSAAEGNPFTGQKGALPEIYTKGHRSPQGLTKNPETGEIWEAEMGPRGGDELNLIKAGADYGWSAVTKGREYNGPKIGELQKAGVEEPVAYWVPSISPSGIAFYSGDKFPKWKGNIFLGTLSGTHLHRVVLDKNKVVKQEELLKDLGSRFRNVRTGPDGYLYFSTDEGQLSRIKNI
jgi:glucose/arabinose dehydrogenase